MDETQIKEARDQMLREIVAETVMVSAKIGKAALDRRVLDAMRSVPRHEFVPGELLPLAYANTPLPIGFGKTISQPFIVALMTDLLELGPEHRVLEIGAGLGYQAAILSGLAARVCTVEIIEELAAEAKKRWARLGLRNIELRVGNGYYGWPERAPFDRMILTAAPELIPPPLLGQLKPGGRMVLPSGVPEQQQLMVVEKAPDGRLTTRELLPVRFTSMEECGEPGGLA